MFVGHYGPAGAVAGERVKLWHGFAAVQFLDFLWAPLVLAGVEKLRIVENFTASNHVDLYYMPYSHSLVMALAWSVVAGAIYMLMWRRAGLTGGVLIAFLVVPLLSIPLVGNAATSKLTSAEIDQTIKQALAEAFGHRSYLPLVSGFFVCGFQVAFITAHFPAYISDIGIVARRD